MTLRLALLARLHAGHLAASARSIAIVKDILVQEPVCRPMAEKALAALGVLPAR